MSDEPALLTAILAHPDEDTPRLMYADWLDEHGRPERAEFIRIQCAPDADETAEARADELEERNRVKWLAGLPPFPEARWEFRRGFPEYLDAPGTLFLERYEAFARVPWLRTLSLYDLDNSAARDFANRDWPSRWVELELMEDALGERFIHGDDCTPAIVAIANSPNVAQLRRLQLSFFDLTPDGISALFSSPYLNDLRSLQLDGAGDELRLHLLRERFGDRLRIG